jgi:transcriptional regulator with XRE-family HTH domain
MSINFSLFVNFLGVLDDEHMITPSQCRAARGLLGWSQQTLADRARVGIMTVHQLEKEGTQPRRATLDVIRRALEAAGVGFIDENGGGPGVRLRKSSEVKSKKK